MLATRTNYAMVWIARRWRRETTNHSVSSSFSIISTLIPIVSSSSSTSSSLTTTPPIMPLPNLSRLFSSIEIAQLSLYLLIAINIGFAVSGTLSTRDLHRVGHTNVQSMIASVFYHTDYVHLFVNMVAIHRYGTQLFVLSSPKAVWQSVWIILISYLVCGIGAFRGIETMSKLQDHVWESSKRDTRNSFRCTH